MSAVARAIVEPGFFENGPVQIALAVSAVVSLVVSALGVITVIRGQAFAGHSLADIGAAGGSGALLVGVGPLWGFFLLALAGAGAMELVGADRRRSRDLATGIVLGAGLGLAALFLYLDSRLANASGATSTILFGSIFAISSATIPVVIAVGAAALTLIAAIYRPLLLSSLSRDLAAARGVRVRLVGGLYLAALAAAVALSCLATGAILSTALLIGPAAGALRLTRRPGMAVIVSAAIAIASSCVGVLLAYDSYYWPPAGHGWPASFFIVVLTVLAYLAASAFASRTRRAA